MPILSDGERQADADNPRGYLEWERIKQLPQDPACIGEGKGKAVKVISRLLLALPEGHEYRVIFMQRPLPEVLASQEVMLRNRGTAKPGAGNADHCCGLRKALARSRYLDGQQVVRQDSTRFLPRSITCCGNHREQSHTVPRRALRYRGNDTPGGRDVVSEPFRIDCGTSSSR
jgi:hypothetical protein